MIYLDHAAATPADSQVLAAMMPYWQDDFFNPSAAYLAAKKVATDLLQARSTVAGILGAHPTEIIFTAGGTEADNLAINGIMKQFPDGNLVVSAIEHDAVLQVAGKYPHQLAPVDKTGLINLPALSDLIDDQTVLVSVMYANNEVGTVQPIAQVAQLIKRVRQDRQRRLVDQPIYLHSDASQASNYLNLQVSRLGVDLMTLNGGKIYGPKQTGALYVKAGLPLEPQIVGGGQEANRRSGTENVAGSIGFATALELAQTKRPAEVNRLSELQDIFSKQLIKAIPEATINCPKHRLPNFVHITLPGYDNELVMMQLDELGIVCAVGSACSASNDEPSHVLKAIGLTDEAAQSSIRFTMGRSTTKPEIDSVVAALKKITAKSVK